MVRPEQHHQNTRGGLYCLHVSCTGLPPVQVGCGTGSTVFPLLERNTAPGLCVYCCDLSSTAVQLVQQHSAYSQARCNAWVCDVTVGSHRHRHRHT